MLGSPSGQKQGPVSRLPNSPITAKVFAVELKSQETYYRTYLKRNTLMDSKNAKTPS